MKLSDYIGLPFLDKGRDTDGLDCWGLVRHYYAHEKKISLPLLDSYQTSKDADSIQEIVNGERCNWLLTDRPNTGDVVVIAIAGKETHVGIYVNHGKMLHAYEGTDSCIVSLDSPRWKSRIKGIYRYE